MNIQSIEGKGYKPVERASTDTTNKVDEFELNDTKTKRERFEEVCKRYPGVSFIVDTNGDKYEYAGICDTKNFGNPGVKSFSISEEVLEKMDDPDYRDRVYGWIDYYAEDKAYESRIGHSDEKYKCLVIEETHGMAKNEFFCSVLGSNSPMSYAQGVNSNATEKVSLLDHEMILKKISAMSEERYNRLINGLFGEKEENNKYGNKYKHL